MSEDKKIEYVLEKYKEYFNNSNSDVCHSNKGIWFFYQYDSKNDIYESFYQFTTAKELEKIIIGEIIETINIALECTAEAIVFANNEPHKIIKVDDIPTDYDFSERVNKLAVNVKAVKQTMHLVEDAYQAILSLIQSISPNDYDNKN